MTQQQLALDFGTPAPAAPPATQPAPPAPSAVPLTSETVKVGDIIENEVGRCVVVELEMGGYVTVRPFGQNYLLPVAPCDIELFHRTGDTDLQPAVLRYLEFHESVRLFELQDKWGYSRLIGNTPDTNPVNRAVKALLDAGQITVQSGDWGYASNPLIKRFVAPPPTLAASAYVILDPRKPLGDVPATDESRYFGSKLTVRSHGVLVHTWLSKVYNRGSLLEVHNPHCPTDAQATFRVSGVDVVSIDELVDRRADPNAPLPM